MKTARDFVCVHSLDQGRQAAEIAHTATRELQVVYASTLD